MVSAIDPTLGGTLPGTGEISAAAMQVNLQVAADEISALQAVIAALLFRQLGDVPNTYSTHGKKVAAVKATADGIEFVQHVGHQDPGRDVVGDAAKTLVVGTAKEMQEWATTLTANRICELPVSNVYAGLEYTIKRSAAGAYYLRLDNLGPGAVDTFDLYQGEWARCRYDGSQWNLVAFGSSGRGIDLRDGLLRNAKIEAYTEVEAAVAPATGTLALDCAAAQVFVVSLTGNVSTIALSNVDTGAHTSVFLYMTQDGTGGRTVAWSFTVNGNAASVLWPGGAAPTVSSAAASRDVYQLTIRSADLTVIHAFPAQAFA